MTVEERKKIWDDFMDNLQKNPEQVVTKADLFKALDYISEDIGSLAQMSMNNDSNIRALNDRIKP